MRERAVVVTLREGMAGELEELARSAALEVVESLGLKLRSPQAPLLIGRGMAERIAQSVKDKKADVVILSSDLSASQQRNLEEILEAKTIDRTQLILDIFARRAKSSEGKLQVELAQLKYLLPRLSGKGIYLSRLGGGIGTRGPGEQKLEVDRRRIRDRIARLGRSLGELQRRRLDSVERKKEKGLPMVALVGYTGAGKSSLFNRLTGASVAVRHQLFSTLDTTTRLWELPGRQKALLVDTVGFVKDLPHHLIESFKATLEEVAYADVLIHVMDAARPDLLEVERAVCAVLDELGVDRKKMIAAFNKIDLVTPEARARLLERAEDATPVSARTGEGLDGLVSNVTQIVLARPFDGHYLE